MPVRIYDISKKLGLENKEVLSKAKELGIAAARSLPVRWIKSPPNTSNSNLFSAHPNPAARPASARSPASTGRTNRCCYRAAATSSASDSGTCDTDHEWLCCHGNGTGVERDSTG